VSVPTSSYSFTDTFNTPQRISGITGPELSALWRSMWLSQLGDVPRAGMHRDEMNPDSLPGFVGSHELAIQHLATIRSR